MGLYASVRCRCWEEGRLRPCPVPLEDIYVDREDNLSSRTLDDAWKRYGMEEFRARYGGLGEAFRIWSDHPCAHERGESCSEHVGSWDDVALFRHRCSVVGEDRLPILSRMLPERNGGSFPASQAANALAELDVLEAELGFPTSAEVLHAPAGKPGCGEVEKDGGEARVCRALRRLLRTSLATNHPIRWC